MIDFFFIPRDTFQGFIAPYYSSVTLGATISIAPPESRAYGGTMF